MQQIEEIAWELYHVQGLIIIGLIMLIVLVTVVSARFIRHAIVLIVIGVGMISRGMYHKKIIFERNRNK